MADENDGRPGRNAGAASCPERTCTAAAADRSTGEYRSSAGSLPLRLDQLHPDFRGCVRLARTRPAAKLDDVALRPVAALADRAFPDPANVMAGSCRWAFDGGLLC